MTIVAVALAFVDDIARIGARGVGVWRRANERYSHILWGYGHGGSVLIMIGRVSPFEEKKSVPAPHTTTPRYDDDDDERHGCEENESTGTRESFDARRRDAGRGESTARGGFSHGWMFEIVCTN